MIVYKFIILIAVLLIAIVWFAVVNSNSRAIPGKRIIMVALGLSLVISAIGLTGFIKKLNTTFMLFIILQALFLIMGFVMMALFKKQYFGKFKSKEVSEIMLLAINTIAGVVGFTLVFNYTSQTDLGLYYASSSICVCIPYFIWHAYKVLPQIPDAIYKVWYLNEDALEPDFEKINVDRVFLVTLYMFKNVNESHQTDFELKAPHEMCFGDWFRTFVLNYNERHSESPIQYNYLDHSSIGWVFYTKPTFWRSKRFIDPTLSFTQNGLDDKALIIASRVKINYQ